MTRLFRSSLVFALAWVACVTASAQARGRDEGDEGGQIKEHSTVLAPANVYSTGFVPVCYDLNGGDARLVRPWSVAADATIVNCQPPAPWDAFNVPPGGWSAAVCTAGGSFDCHSNEAYTELATGPQGPTGATGPAGATGPMGPVGPTGPRGLKGDNGAAGQTGQTGQAGPKGATGEVGPVGPRGSTGPMGPAGLNGAPGDLGPTGPIGPAGPQGGVGPEGPAGSQGPAGLKGDGFRFVGAWDINGAYLANDVVTEGGSSYVARIDAPAGEPAIVALQSGADWALFVARGERGAPGQEGAQGIPGPFGPIGLTGPAGEVGPTGPAGSQGPAGAKGDGFRFVGAWDSNGAYLANDVVTEGGSSYVARIDAPSGDPANVALEPGADWAPFVARGERGATGPEGAQGIPGPFGPIGSAGPAGEVGPAGPVGPQGPAGSKGDGFRFAGAWDSTGAYLANDVVTEGGSAYVARIDAPSGDPANVALQPGADWTLFVTKGEPGTPGPAGATGVAGSIGPAGQPGSNGAEGPAGPAGPVGPQGTGFTFRGAWDSATAYHANDVVTEGGSGYVARADSTATDPAIASQFPGTEWAVLVAKGETGATGAAGAAGLAGADGATGLQGPQGTKGDQGPAGPGRLVVAPQTAGGTFGAMPNFAVNLGVCTSHLEQPILVPATPTGGKLIVSGWMRVVLSHTAGALDRGFAYPSLVKGDCGASADADAVRSYWRVASAQPTDAGYEVMVPIHAVFAVDAAGGPLSIFVNTRKDFGAGQHADFGLNIDVTFVPG